MKMVRVAILIVMIVLFVFTIYYKPKVINSDTTCRTDEDCTFARTICCPGSNDFIAVNLNTSQRIEAVMGERCANSTCAPFDWREISGQGVVTKPACIKEDCSYRFETNCNAICEYNKLGQKAQYKAYLDYSANVLNTTSDELVASCNCV
jgi:hypothetical protein